MTIGTHHEINKLIKEVMGVDIEKMDQTKKLSTIDEWDSFNNLMLISKVEEAFKIKFSISELDNADTIKKVIDLIEKKMIK